MGTEALAGGMGAWPHVPEVVGVALEATVVLLEAMLLMETPWSMEIPVVLYFSVAKSDC